MGTGFPRYDGVGGKSTGVGAVRSTHCRRQAAAWIETRPYEVVGEAKVWVREMRGQGTGSGLDWADVDIVILDGY